FFFAAFFGRLRFAFFFAMTRLLEGCVSNDFAILASEHAGDDSFQRSRPAGGTLRDGRRMSEPPATSRSGKPTDASREVERARETYAAKAWDDAYQLLSAADRATPLEVEDF